MKSISFILTTLAFVVFTTTSYSQNDTKIGALLGYGTEIENIGIGADAEFPVMEKLTISPSFIYYLPKDEFGIKLNWFEFNADANYYFLTEDNLDIYGIGGLNYSSVSIDYDGTSIFGEDRSVNDGRFGLNIGGGANFNIGSGITPFAELKYVVIDGGQLVIAAGVKFNI